MAVDFKVGDRGWGFDSIMNRNVTAFVHETVFLLGSLAAIVGHVFHVCAVVAGHVTEQDPVLWALGPGEAGQDACHVQLQCRAVYCFRRVVLAEHALCFGIGFDQHHLVFRATGQAHVIQAFPVDRENTASSTVFRRHIGDGCPVGQWQLGQPLTKKFDEFSNHAVLP